MRRLNTSLIVIVVLLTSLSIFGQTTGTLIGNVMTDSVPLPGVTVSVSSENLQGQRTAVTDVNGNFTIGALPPGRYNVVFELEGMQTVQRNVKIDVAGTTRADAAMLLSSVAEAITVTATAPATLETQEVQTNLTSDLVEELPVGRTILATVSLAPGVNANGPGGATTISGAPSYDSQFNVDGTVVNEVLRGQPQTLFIEDAIEETTVMTGAISAEFGRFTGGVVNTVTKSGGNQFEGSFRDSFTDPSWTDTTPFGEEEAESSLNEVYEATLGGYIVRDRLWFFTAGRYFDTNVQNFFAESLTPYTASQEETRLQGKLTAQVTPNHSIFGSYLDINDIQGNNSFGIPAEASHIDPEREVPEAMLSLHYSGILTSNFLVEAGYADKSLGIVGSGGPDGSFVNATPIRLIPWEGANAYAGAPTFCEDPSCDETRDSKNYSLKGTYYLSTSGLGTHNIVAGYDDFTEGIDTFNRQAGSDFNVWTYNTPTRGDDGELLLSMNPGAGLIIYWPVLEDGAGSDFSTRSLFVNDRWDFNSQLSFNLGVRYDENDAQDASGNTVADDSRVSPRVGMTYDVLGDGRLRASASYGEYVTKIATGNVGGAGSAAGSPSLLYWLYGGPAIRNQPTEQFLAMVEEWFLSEGGINGQDWLLGGSTAGITTVIPNKLVSPAVTEYTVGLGTTLGTRGFVRLDYQNRVWEDFYGSQTDTTTGRAFDPLAGTELDRTYVVNTNAFERNYDAILVQAGYRVSDRINIGGNYTWSELTGNIVGETTGSGPVASSGVLSYPEFYFEQSNPVGRLPQDQEHKLRAWVSYDLPTTFGQFNFSLLQRWDSGLPYSLAGSVDMFTAEEMEGFPENPGYKNPPTSSTYYFSKRGEFEFEDLTATDLAVNYSLPLGPVDLYVQGEVLNLFNESAQLLGNTNVFTAKDGAPDCVQANGSECEIFNPFTETPVEGVHYVRGDSFGEARSPNDYQNPRTYRFSAGFRF